MGTLVLVILLGCLTCQVLGQFPNFPTAQNPNFGGGGGGGGGAWPGNPGFPVGGNPGMPTRPGNPGMPLAGCRPGWTNFGNYCYKYFFQRLPYNQANQMCMRFSAMPVPGAGGFGFGGGRPRQQPGGPMAPQPGVGHLIVTKDMAHNKFQHNWLRYTGASGNKVWMGLKELGQETNRYFWADGTELFYTRGYPFFNRFKPDQPQQNSIQQAVHSFNNRPDNTWVTTNIETEVSFICQYQYKF